MNDKHDSDREIRNLFSEARRCEEARTPGFDALRARPLRPSWGSRRGPRLLVLTTAGTLAIAATVLTLELPEPVVELVGAPEIVELAAPSPPPAPAPVPTETAEKPAAPPVVEAQAAPSVPTPPKKRNPSPKVVEQVEVAAEPWPAATAPEKAETSEELIVDLPVPSQFLAVGTRGSTVHGVMGGVVGGTIPSEDDAFVGADGFNTESYARIQDSGFVAVADEALSTFSIDVDTASYSNVRRMLAARRLPPADAVRIEELLNYFRYDYPEPDGEAPFSVSVEIGDAPWNRAHRLARIGLRGRSLARSERGGANLVFLLDVSGSMDSPAKLPLLEAALRLLVEQLDSRDQVAIVVYAGATGLVLPPTPGHARGSIHDAIDRLEAGGSTNGGAGLELAYRLAREHLVAGGVNRVILATDGDFNVGTTSKGDLERIVREGAEAGVSLTTLGFGMGNYKDDMLELLADRGNGNYAYIDSLDEARKVLVEEIGGTLVTIAKDVKIQVELNPTEVGAYRLIGYENRRLDKQDFNDDTKDAGEIGAGHTVTALYELVPPGAQATAAGVDPLRYQRPLGASERAASGESLTIKLRYKDPDGKESRLLELPVHDEGGTFESASEDFRFACAVAAFGMILRDSPHAGEASFDLVRKLALSGIGADASGYRKGFLTLVDGAEALRPNEGAAGRSE